MTGDERFMAEVVTRDFVTLTVRLVKEDGTVLSEHSGTQRELGVLASVLDEEASIARLSRSDVLVKIPCDDGGFLRLQCEPDEADKIGDAIRESLDRISDIYDASVLFADHD